MGEFRGSGPVGTYNVDRKRPQSNMELPAVDEIEIAGAVKELLNRFGNVMGEKQARNIAYVALIGARGAKIDSKRQQKS